MVKIGFNDNWKRIIAFIRNIVQNSLSSLIWISVIGIMDVGATLLFVWMSKTVIDTAVGEKEGSLLWYSVSLVGLLIAQILLDAFDVQLRNMTKVHIENSIRQTLFSNLLYSKWLKLSNLHSGDTMTRLIRDCDDLVTTLVTGIPLILVAFAQLIGAFVFLSFLDFTLAIILVCILPLFLVCSKLYFHKMSYFSRKIKENESFINSLLQESLMNQIVIRTFERQDKELQRLDGLQNNLQVTISGRTRITIFSRVMVMLSFGGGYIIAFLRGTFLLSLHQISFGTLTAFLQLVGRIQNPLYNLMRFLPSLVATKAALDRMIMLTSLEKEELCDPLVLDGKLRLCIEKVTYSYEGKMDSVLSEFSMTAEPGEMTAVIGETGAGKTTLLRLILALVEPNQGKIELDNGKKRVKVSPNTRSNFVYVPQGNTLFSGSIRGNLLVGNPYADEVQLREVLEIAVAEFVYNLPYGLDTHINENGVGLSEGQAQRIALARSLLRKGSVLLLDEATSSLDTETEAQLLINLKKCLKNRTVLFITHHDVVAKACDKVYRIV